MNILLLCFILTTCIVTIYDVFNAPLEIMDQLLRIFTKGKFTHFNLIKPFNCSLCMSFWITLIIILLIAPQYFYMSLIFAWSTQYILQIIKTVDLLLTLIFGAIQTYIKKLINKL